MSISQSLLPEFDQEMANTRKILERVPEGRSDYKPHEKSMPLERLAAHVAELPDWAKMTLTTERLDLSSADFKPYLMTTRQELLDKFDKSVREARETIAATPDEAFGVTWSLTFNGQPVFSMPRLAVYRTSFMNHIIHHRAQLGVYLRLNDVEIPGMYGPSADEMKFWDSKPQTQTA